MKTNEKNAPHEPIRVSAVQYPGTVGKKLTLSDDGDSLQKVPHLAMRAETGKLLDLEFSSPEEFFNYRENADARTMFLSGTFEPAMTCAEVVPEGRLNVGERLNGTLRVAATKDYLVFREGPGVISIDIDVKSTDEVEAIYPEAGTEVFETAEEAIEALYQLVPEARGCPIMAMPSSGSMIERTSDGKLVKGPGGWRILLPTSNAALTREILEIIHLRCWALGLYNYAFISKSGAFLVRSLADQALARPTQPDYAMAELGEGLRKASGASLMLNLDGELFDPASVQITMENKHKAKRNIAAARAKLTPDEERVITTRTKAEVESLVSQGVPRPAAERAARQKFEHGILLGSDMITFDDGEPVSVGTLLSEAGAEFDGRICLDPIEPEYDGGRAVGMFFWNDGLNPGVHSYAHGSRFYAMKHDEDSAREAISQADGDAAVIARAIALAELSDLETQALETQAARALGLGNRRQALRDEIARERNLSRAASPREETTHEPSLPQDLDEALDLSGFPHSRLSANGTPSPIDHKANLAHMLDSYGLEYRYNQITKRMEWEHPDIAQEGDNAENRLYSEICSLAALNHLPEKNLDTHLTALGDANSYNPVTDYLSGLIWDKTPRISRMAAALNASDPDIAEIALRVFLIQACAAADCAETARASQDGVEAHFEYVLVLMGEQGKGKTKGFRKILPPALREFYKESQVLNLADKDSVKRVLSGWIVELGELDATFGKSAISQKKAFLSQSEDEIRAPYARKSSRYGRRTAFVGSVNEDSFLVDETGNRRYLPLSVGKITLDWTEDELNQLWAEAWEAYVSGTQWWPTDEETVELEANAEKYRIRSEIEERIEREYQWSKGPIADQRMTASEIYDDVMPHGSRLPSDKELKTIGASVKRLWNNSGLAKEKHGQLVIQNSAGKDVSLNATSGKNRGWLLPPKRNVGAEIASTFPTLKKERKK